MDEKEGADRVRIDKWLWAARFYKTRSTAAEAVTGGKVHVNGERVKAAKLLRVGDELRIRNGPFEHELHVRALSERRGPASVAPTLYEETPESRAARERTAAHLRLMAAAEPPEKGRPTKKDRRDMARFLGERGKG
jgi:ribosome-associated heat shock protein Hsp15